MNRVQSLNQGTNINNDGYESDYGENISPVNIENISKESSMKASQEEENFSKAQKAYSKKVVDIENALRTLNTKLSELQKIKIPQQKQAIELANKLINTATNKQLYTRIKERHEDNLNALYEELNNLEKARNNVLENLSEAQKNMKKQEDKLKEITDEITKSLNWKGGKKSRKVSKTKRKTRRNKH